MVESKTGDTDKDLWFIDCASNVHVVHKKSYFVRLNETTRMSSKLPVRAMGIETIRLQTEVNGQRRQIVLSDILYIYIPDADHCLLSPGLARKQGYTLRLNESTAAYSLLNEEVMVLETSMTDDGMWPFYAKSAGDVTPIDAVVNFTASDGVATMKQ